MTYIFIYKWSSDILIGVGVELYMYMDSGALPGRLTMNYSYFAFSEWSTGYKLPSRMFPPQIMGLVVMILGWLQPLNAFIRPHPAAKNEEKPKKRLVWEIVHKVPSSVF